MINIMLPVCFQDCNDPAILRHYLQVRDAHIEALFAKLEDARDVGVALAKENQKLKRKMRVLEISLMSAVVLFVTFALAKVCHY